MLPGQEDQKRSHIQQVERAVLANPHSSLREITDKSDMNCSICENRLVLKYWYHISVAAKPPQSTFGSARTSWSV